MQLSRPEVFFEERFLVMDLIYLKMHSITQIFCFVVSLKKCILFIYIFKYIGKRVFIIISTYFLFNAHQMCRHIPFLIPDINLLCLLFPASCLVSPGLYKFYYCLQRASFVLSFLEFFLCSSFVSLLLFSALSFSSTFLELNLLFLL